MKLSYAKNFFEIANIHVSDKNLIYKFKISSVSNTLKLYNEFVRERSCLIDFYFKEKFKFEITNNMLWNKTSNMTKEDSDKDEINIHFLYDIVLNSNLDTLTSNESINLKCLVLNETMMNFIRINNILNELYRHNTLTIFEVITEEQLMRDIKNVYHNFRDEGIFSLEALNHFDNNLFKLIEFSFQHKEFEITLNFTLPLFKKDLLYRIYPKPIVVNDEPYILNIDIKYAFLNTEQNVFYTSETFEINCFWHLRELYCYIPKEDNLANEISIQTENFMQNYVKLETKNIITQIEQNTYFIVFEPTIVQINCNNSEYRIKMFNHTQILKNYECSILRSYFEYVPSNETNYKIYIDESNSTDNLIQKIKHENEIRTIKF